MSHDLHPTPTRLALLADVNRQRITRDYFADATIDRDVDGRTVAARVAEAETAGWIYLGDVSWATADPVTGASWSRRYWRLTAAGREVLSHHGGAA